MIQELIDEVGIAYISQGIHEFIEENLLWRQVINDYGVTVYSELIPFHDIAYEGEFKDREQLAEIFLRSDSTKATGIRIRCNRYYNNMQMEETLKEEYESRFLWYVANEIDYRLPIVYAQTYTNSNSYGVYNKIIESISDRYQYESSLKKYVEDKNEHENTIRTLPATERQIAYMSNLVTKGRYLLNKSEVSMYEAGVIIDFLNSGEDRDSSVTSLLVTLSDEEFADAYLCKATTRARTRCKKPAQIDGMCAQHSNTK